jgi:uncharacterized protein YceK
MKKLLMLLAFGCVMSSCDYILKSDEEKNADKKQQVVTGTDTDKDEKGCVISAGYRWSMLKDDCIRPVEEGYRLNSIDLEEGESTYKSAFVTFDEDKEKAELFLPNVRTSNILKKDKKGVYADKHWVLNVNQKYNLQKDGILLYVGAKVQEGQVTGNDDPQE